MRRPPPISTLFPYTTLFRSRADAPVWPDGFDPEVAEPSAPPDPPEWRAAGLPPGFPRRGCTGAVSRPGATNSAPDRTPPARSEEHTSELQSHSDLVCRLLLE